MTPVISCSVVSMTPAKNLSPVSTTQVNNLYFPGVVDIVKKKKTESLKFIAGVNNTDEKLFTKLQRFLNLRYWSTGGET
jgi:hypothetical protein